MFSNAEMTQLLIQSNASLDEMDIYHKTPLNYAENERQYDIVKVIKKAKDSLTWWT